MDVGFTEEEIKVKVVQGGQHNEQLWREEFGEAYEWLFLDNSSSVTDNPVKSPVEIHISGGKLLLKRSGVDNPCDKYSVSVFSISGQEILQTEMVPDSSVTLPPLATRQCVVSVSCEHHSYSVKVMVGMD